MNTPRMVPIGITVQLIAAITILKVLRVRLAMERPEMIVRIPSIVPSRTKLPPATANMNPNQSGGGLPESQPEESRRMDIPMKK